MDQRLIKLLKLIAHRSCIRKSWSTLVTLSAAAFAGSSAPQTHIMNLTDTYDPHSMSLFYANELTQKIKPLDSFPISFSLAVSIILRAPFNFVWIKSHLPLAIHGLTNCFWMSKSTKRGDAGLQGYFLAARALYEYILRVKSHSSHTRSAILTSSAQNKRTQSREAAARPKM